MQDVKLIECPRDAMQGSLERTCTQRQAPGMKRLTLLIKQVVEDLMGQFKALAVAQWQKMSLLEICPQKKC